MHSVERAGLQSGMSESNSAIVELCDIPAEDIKIILKYIYGELEALPEERLHHLIAAADHLEACHST